MGAEESFKKDYADIDREKQKIEAETKVLVAKVNEQKIKDQQIIVLEAEKYATQVKGETDQIVKEIKAKGRQEAAQIDAQKEAYIKKREAESNAQVAEKFARALQIESQAEGNAKTLLAGKRDFEERMR